MLVHEQYILTSASCIESVEPNPIISIGFCGGDGMVKDPGDEVSVHLWNPTFWEGFLVFFSLLDWRWFVLSLICDALCVPGIGVSSLILMVSFGGCNAPPLFWMGGARLDWFQDSLKKVPAC